jgi:RimJ/RimL family protein N-acetyltransferase
MNRLEVQTARLILRPPEMEDFDDFAAFCADPEVMHFLGGAQARSVAWRGFSGVAGAWMLLGFSMFSVFERATGRWIGRVGPHKPVDWPGTEVGWGLIRSAWGQGYAVEAAEAAMDYAVDHLGWTDIIHCIDKDNTPSQAVAQRLGSSRRGTAMLPAPASVEVEIWAQSADQWRARRGRN